MRLRQARLPRENHIWTALRSMTLFASCAAIAACGGGGGNSNPSTPAPASLQYSTPPPFTINTAIAALAPTATGTVTSYSVSPALPAGLTLDTSTGIISGTPSVLAAKATYTVTAMNSGGSTTATVSIEVDDVKPVVAYATPSFSYTNGVAANTVTPTTSGGKVVTWSISPALPAGLALSATDGSISGTPTAGAPAANYVVTAANSGGQVTATLSIAVATAPLLDLGHATTLQFIRFDGSHVLSKDQVGHWVLWNYATQTQIASGNAPCTNPFLCTTGSLPVALAGPTVVIGTATGIEVRSSSSGQVLAEISTGSDITQSSVPIPWWTLATDGSYVCSGNATVLGCWSPTGTQLFAESGSYSSAQTFATPAALLVASGANGASVIETVSMPSGTSSVGPSFSGTFYSWFPDGSRFFTTAPATNTLWIYSNATVQQDMRSLPSLENLTGEGAWFSTYQPNVVMQPLNIYAVGNSALPTATYNLGIDAMAIPSGSTIGLIGYGGGAVTVVDLSGATPVQTAYTLPFGYVSTYAALSASQWMAGNQLGVLADAGSSPASPRYFGYGAALSIAGGNSRVAVATASGGVLSFNAATNALEQTINFSSSNVAISTDGTVLAAQSNQKYVQYGAPDIVNVYALPAGTVTESLPGAIDMTLSGSGTVLGELVETSSLPSFANETIAVNGGQVTWTQSPQYSQPDTVGLSPDGTLAAVSSASPVTFPTTAISTSIYQNGTLVTTLSGWKVGWLDDSRLLVNSYSPPNTTYTGASIYGPTGKLLSTPNIPELRAVHAVTADLVYSPGLNEILSLSTGAVTWSSGDPTARIGAIAGSEVVFVSGNLVLAQTY